MKNITHEKPTLQLTGRLLATVGYVKDADIKNKTILDVGCGYGWCELNFLSRGAKKIGAIEITEEDLHTIKEGIHDEKVECRIGSAIAVPYPDETFDTVVAWEVLEHIPLNTEMKMFEEVSRVLKKGGAFYLSTPFNNIITTTLDPAHWLIGHRHYTQKQIEDYAKAHGLKLVDFQVRGGKWATISLLNMYISKWILRRKPLNEPYFSKKETEEYSKKGGTFNIFARMQKI